MKIIMNFYKELDALNLILFWGIIIVIILLLIFAITISKTNKKLKRMLNEEMKRKQTIDMPIKNNAVEDNIILQKREEDNNLEEKTSFIAEEHVMEYNKLNLLEEDNIGSKNNEIIREKQYNTVENKINKNNAYQKNLLKEISSNQTSPIGINKPINEKQGNDKNIKEMLTSDSHFEDTKETITKLPNGNEIVKKQEINNVTDNISKQKFDKSEDKKSYSKIIDNNSSYLSDLSKTIDNKLKDSIKRTNYEVQQEEDAIISYKELMSKKNDIKEIEEDAIISIKELMNSQGENNYKSSEETENNEFIEELKIFRENLKQ